MPGKFPNGGFRQTPPFQACIEALFEIFLPSFSGGYDFSLFLYRIFTINDCLFPLFEAVLNVLFFRADFCEVLLSPFDFRRLFFGFFLLLGPFNRLLLIQPFYMIPPDDFFPA
jgi:hypothetical protein